MRLYSAPPLDPFSHQLKPRDIMMPTDDSQIVWRTDPPTSRPPARSFLPLLRAAVAARPDRADLRRDLAVALRDDQRWAEILDLLSPLAEEGALTAALACELARAAIACEQPELALRALDATPDGTGPDERRQRIFALYALNRIDEARAAVAQALEEDPDDGAVLDAFAKEGLLFEDCVCEVPLTLPSF